MIGAEMMTHLVGSPSRKFASFAWPVNVLKRNASLVELKPALPAITIDDLIPDGVDSVVAAVLPRAVVLRAALNQAGRMCALTERLWNCSVEKPRLMLFASEFGTRDSRPLQNAVSVGFSPRVSHLAASFTKCPSELMMPPSEPSQ